MTLLFIMHSMVLVIVLSFPRILKSHLISWFVPGPSAFVVALILEKSNCCTASLKHTYALHCALRDPLLSDHCKSSADASCH